MSELKNSDPKDKKKKKNNCRGEPIYTPITVIGS